MRMKPIVILIVIAVLALTGAAEAAIASSGGGLSSAITGAGFSSAASSLSAGHSASVSKMLTQTLNSAGSFSTSTSGTESATDGTVTVNVQAANLRITGSLDGLGTVTATARVAANGDENPGPISSIWVNTLIEALTNVFVTPGVHGRATASATGTATARGTNAGVGTVTALSQGTATASSDARDLFANGANANAISQIWSDATLYNFGTGIGIDEYIEPLWCSASTSGGGTASSTASGSSRGTATSTTGSGTISATGRTAAAASSTGDRLSTWDTTGYAEIDAEFEKGVLTDFRYVSISSNANAAGVNNPGFPDYHGTASASATGSVTVNGQDTLAGATYRDTASGRVASSATQDGVGKAYFGSWVYAADGEVNGDQIALDIPRDPFAGPLWITPALGTSYEFDTTSTNHDESEIASMVDVEEEGGRGTGSASATGNAATSTTIGAWVPPVIPGDRTTTTANGQTAISGTVVGGILGTPIYLDGTGSVMSQAMTEGSTDYYDLTTPGPALGTFDTRAGAVSVVNGHLVSDDNGIWTNSFTGSVSAAGQTTASATNDGVITADAASRAGANLQGRISGSEIEGMAYGAESYGFAFTGTNADGGPLFGNPTAEFAIAESAIEARAVMQDSMIGSPPQSASGRITGGSGHGDAGFAVPGIVGIDVRSDTSGSTDVSESFRDTLGVSQTRAATFQGAAFFPLSGTADVMTDSSADTLTRAMTGNFNPTTHGSISAGLTGVRTWGAGTYDLLVPGAEYTVSSDATLSGGIMRTTENTVADVDGFAQTSADVFSYGSHDPLLGTDHALVQAYYYAQDEGLDGLNQRGAATITGLSLIGHAASEGDSARLTLTGGMAQVNLNTLPNSATITFPVRTATLGGTPAATLGMNQGVLTGSSVTAPVNFAFGEWAGIADSQNPGVPVPFVPLPTI